jgi:photosystem II stability/assembly factor-like uncharacterized protein
MKILIALFMLTISAVAQSSSPVAAVGDSNLRGVSVVNDEVVWVSGSKGTIARSTDGGNSWERITPPGGAKAFDYRDVEAFSANVAYVMSVGSGEQSRIWKTTDGGKTWRRQYTNLSPDFFLDSLACWNKKHCVALSDPVGGKFVALMTEDGEHWHELPRDHMPPALVEKRKTADGKDDDLKEGAFAASGTAITVFGPNIWFGTGGPKARVFHSADRGKTWSVAETPIMHGDASQGIFSIAFSNARFGIVVGGDYKEPDKIGTYAAVTRDGGHTWKRASTQPRGYRSAIWWNSSRCLGPASIQYAFGTNGADTTTSSGERWSKFAEGNFNAADFINCSHGWAVGPNGTITKFGNDEHK